MAYLASASGFKRLWTWFAERVDREDLQSLIGLGLLSYGVSLLSVAWALIVAGAILLLSGYGREIAGLIAVARGPRKLK